MVEVNGKVISELGYQVQKTDRVVFDGQGITPEKPVYVLLNKPKGYISTTKDEKMRKTVMDLVANASPYRLFPVGRLDRSTTGVILLTNDGHMTKKLTHPSFNMKKIYHVTLDRKISKEDMQAIADGIRLEEGVAEVDAISYIDGKPKNEVGIEMFFTDFEKLLIEGFMQGKYISGRWNFRKAGNSYGIYMVAQI